MSDVCLVLEGTYPYVRGGVSSWVHQIISNLPEVKFSILSIMPSIVETQQERYEVPSNVESIINVYLHDYSFEPKLITHKTKEIFTFFDMFYKGIEEVSREKLELFILDLAKKRESLDNNYAFVSRDFWKAVENLYNNSDKSISFIDFFWNYRFTFLPLLQILKAEIPPAQIYHTISTGYAGVLASLAKIKYNSSMITTEHGIYTKERRIEIAQAGWIYEKENQYIKATYDLGFFKNWWTKYFSVMSKLCYTYSDQITTLYNGNKESEIKDGAPEDKISIIANGIDLDRFKQIDVHKKIKKRKTIGYVGRIVPIKDVKTLIKSCKIIVDKIPDARILLIGPQEEESQYYQECSVLVKILGLEKNVVFTGHVDTKDYYPEIDVLLLTSISEAQPLVVLEAFAFGIPVVATDVGSCQELLEGADEEDKALGPSGIICPFYSPGETAKATLELLENDDLYYKMSEAGLKRVRKYYNQKDMIVAYKNLYEQYL